MTGRRAATIAVALALCWVVMAGAPGAVGTGPDTAAAAGPCAAKRSASARAACLKRCRARPTCRRRALVVAGYRRGARGGRAVLAGPVAGRAPSGAVPSAVGGAPAAGGDATPAPATGSDGTAAPAPPVASSVGAEAYDFGSFVLRLTRASVPAGDLTIYFRNYDIAEHNLWLDPPAAAAGSPRMISEAVGEGGGATKTVRVTPGTWRLYCSLDGHGAMTRDLAVE